MQAALDLPRRSRRASRLALLLALLPLWLRALAARADDAPLVVEIAPSLAHLDPQALRRAIGDELHTDAVTPADARRGQARGTIVIALEQGALVMTFRSRTGAALVRRLKLPAEPEAQVTTIALLAGNLARDEAAELLAGLARPSASAAVSASSSLVASSASSSPGASALAPPPASSAPPVASSAPAASSSAAPAASAPTPVASAPGRCMPPVERAEPFAVQILGPVGYPAPTPPFRTTLALSPFYGRVDEIRDGVQLSGLLAQTAGTMRGVQLGGLGALAEGEVEGAALAGLVQLGGCSARGATGAGLLAVQLGELRGVTGAGLLAVAGGLRGVQLAGLMNYVNGDVLGWQSAGLLNVARGRVEGLQLSVANAAIGELRGAQLGVANLAGDLGGVQVGVVNLSDQARGVQIGVVNLARRQDGLALGVLSLAGNSRVFGAAWLSRASWVNAGVQVLTGPTYQMLSVGYGSSLLEGGASLGYALGLHLDLGPVYTEADIGYHVVLAEGLRGRSGEPEHTTRLRALVGLPFGQRVALFAGLGVAVWVRANQETRPEPDATVGVRF